MELVILFVVLGLLAATFFLFVGPYNTFVRLRNVIQESWRQVDVELNRRYELIPNLVETVRAYSAHERNTLEEVTRLRNAARGAAQQGGDVPTEQRADLESQLSGAVHNLMVSVEAYPDLKSNQNFLELQRELSGTEDRIAAGRRFYNANVRAYNTKTEQIPSNLVASVFNFEKATYFEVKDPEVRQAPGVNFGEISRRDDPQQASGQQVSGQQTRQLGQGTSQPGSLSHDTNQAQPAQNPQSDQQSKQGYPPQQQG